jgi:hypothetical protein
VVVDRAPAYAVDDLVVTLPSVAGRGRVRPSELMRLAHLANVASASLTGLIAT